LTTELFVRNAYYRLPPQTAIQEVARPTMIPVYNWQKTRAFSLPTDQYGWIRINLKGREVKGSVALSDYSETRDELEVMLRGLKDSDGRPLVREIVRTVADESQAAQYDLPDLVVHWRDEAFTLRLRIANTNLECQPVGIKTGQHALDGFCVLKGGPKDLGTSILAQEMSSLITRMVVQ
jgi:predicted AlkP superfamily phosphohydrolase/phosphomutase